MMSSSRAKLSGTYRINLSDTHFYVGRSSDIKRRAKDHLGLLRRSGHPNAYMQNVYNQHGLFRWEVLRLCASINEAEGAEQALLDSLIGTAGCVNLSPSAVVGPGMAGKQHTEETKRKIRESKALSPYVISDEHRQRLSRHSHPQSEETKQKISIARTGMIFSESHRQALSVAKKGTIVSDDARQAMSRAGKLRWARVRESQEVRVRTR